MESHKKWERKGKTTTQLAIVLRWAAYSDGSDTGWMVETERNKKKNVLLHHRQQNQQPQQQKLHLKSQRIWAHFSIYITIHAMHAWAATFCCLFVYNSCNSNANDTTATGFPLPISVRVLVRAPMEIILVRHTHAISMSWFMYKNKWK